MKRFVFLVLVVLAALPGERIVAQDAPVTTALTGSAFVYAVLAGDTLKTIGARFGASASTLVPLGPDRPGPLVEGEWLFIDNRHIAVLDGVAQISINIAQRMLYLADGDAVYSYPVAVGTRPWPTPVGTFTVVDKEENPTWDVPLSIQDEMRRQGRPVVTRVPPSPKNPLGAHWIRLSFPSLGIHGTTAPGSIYSYASHGCIRMHPDDAAELFERVGVGTTGAITYQPVLIAMFDDRIYVEAHPDVYRRAPAPMAHVRAVSERNGFAELVDWPAVAGVLRQQRGIATDVTKDE
jgi:L,D-transpeptidase ErfK/SrfK